MFSSKVNVPPPDEMTQAYWDGAAAGELRIQRCVDCGVPYFYPRPICPSCGSGNVEWFTASGDATLYSYVINYRPAPGFDGERERPGHGDGIACLGDGGVEQDCVVTQLHRRRSVRGHAEAGVDDQRNFREMRS